MLREMRSVRGWVATVAAVVAGCSLNTGEDMPAAPQNLRARALSESDVEVSWRDASDNERGFEIFEQVNLTGGFVLAAVTQPNTEFHLLENRQTHTTYRYRVCAYNDAGRAYASDTAQAATVDVPPARPTDLRAEVRHGTDVMLRWRDRSALESGYRVFIGAAAEEVDSVCSELAADVDSAEIRDLEPLNAYFFGVEAFNDWGACPKQVIGPVNTGRRILYVQLDQWRPPEVRLHTNLYVTGRVVTSGGTPQRGIRVYFQVEPPSRGNITPWATTQPDSANGFNTLVTFYGLEEGLAAVIGRGAADSGIVPDTIYVQVLP